MGGGCLVLHLCRKFMRNGGSYKGSSGCARELSSVKVVIRRIQQLASEG